jgi:hypothetical protein
MKLIKKILASCASTQFEMLSQLFMRRPLVFHAAIILILFLSDGRSAQFDSQTVEAIGSGKTREVAIQAALMEAVSKVNGIELGVEAAVELSSLDITRNAKMVSLTKEEYSSRIRKASGGCIEKWELVKENHNNDYSVVITAVVLKISNAGQHDTRKSIAILGFNAAGGGLVTGRIIPNEVIEKGVRDSLVTYLTSSRKFAVIDDSFKAEVSALETDSNQDGGALQAAISRANHLKADFIAIGTIDGFEITNHPVIVGDQVATINKVSGVVRLRIIKVATHQAVLAADFKLSKIANVNLLGAHPESSIFDSVGNAMADRILNTIYPVRVVGITAEGQVVLDRGGETMKVGDEFGVFDPSDEMTDHSTGESLGSIENRIGKISVVRVLPKVSYAKVLSSSSSICVDNICRKDSDGKKTSSQKQMSPSSTINNLFK